MHCYDEEDGCLKCFSVCIFKYDINKFEPLCKGLVLCISIHQMNLGQQYLVEALNAKFHQNP